MNRGEVVALMAYLNRAGLLYVTEGQDEVWSNALQDIDAHAGAKAVESIVKERTSDQPRLLPGDVRKAALKKQPRTQKQLERMVNEWRN